MRALGWVGPSTDRRRYPCALLALVGVLPSCVSESVATLEPIRCGVDPSDLDGLHIETVGDFPPGEAISARVGAGGVRLEDLAPDVDAIVVEGLFGEQIEALGRTARLQDDGLISVFFAPPNYGCPVPFDGSSYHVGAMTVLPNGVVVAVGGRSANGQFLDRIVVYGDTFTDAAIAGPHLARPAVGQTVVGIADDRALVIGGAGDGVASLETGQVIEVTEFGDVRVGDLVQLFGAGEGRSHHGAVATGEGRVLVAGGCTSTIEGECVSSEESVLSSARWITPQADGLFDVSVAPPLLEPRYGHRLLEARDGVIFAVGGLGVDGTSRLSTEVLLPNSDVWARYGPSLEEVLVEGERIVGGTLLEGGTVVVGLSTGRLLWFDESNVQALEGWCMEPSDPCWTPADSMMNRHFATLPGQRVLVDHLILNPASIGDSGIDTIDLSEDLESMTARAGATSAVLADGTAVVMGGVGEQGGLVDDWLARVRPHLDGPDETIPNLNTVEPGDFLLHESDSDVPRIAIVGGSGLSLDNAGLAERDDQLTTWALVRSFRSRQFRLQLYLEANREARPRLVLSAGAIARYEIRFDADAVRYVERGADGELLVATCAQRELVFSGIGDAIEVDVAPEAIVITDSSGEVTRCPGIGDARVSVGLGVVGDGTVRVSEMRLTRT